jgi:hypothetical protein
MCALHSALGCLLKSCSKPVTYTHMGCPYFSVFSCEALQLADSPHMETCNLYDSSGEDTDRAVATRIWLGMGG